MIILYFRLLAKFTFPSIVFYSALGIGLYLFAGKKVIVQFKKIKKMIGHHTRLLENDDLLFWRAPAIKKNPPFSMHAGY